MGDDSNGTGRLVDRHVRLVDDWWDDPKVQTLIDTGRHDAVLLWLVLITEARKGAGVIPRSRVRGAAGALAVDVTLCCDALVTVGLLVEDEQAFAIPTWGKYQKPLGRPRTNAERQADYRARRAAREADNVTDERREVTKVTARNADLDLDVEGLGFAQPNPSTSSNDDYVPSREVGGSGSATAEPPPAGQRKRAPMATRAEQLYGGNEDDPERAKRIEAWKAEVREAEDGPGP